MFLGEYQHSLDAKGRVILPARFRDQLEGGAVMAKALDGCLAVYPVEEFHRVAANLREARARGATERQAARTYFAGAVEITPDKQGRVAVPAHVRTFAELSGDYNPLHFDEAFASRTKFGRLVVQGGLTTGLLHALVAMDMPGPGTVFLSQDWKFTAPVYIGDTITAEAEVLSVHPSKPVTELRVLNRFERIFDEYAYSTHVVRLWQGLAAYANVTVGQMMVAVVLIIGAYEISAGNMTIGGLSTCSLLVGRVIAPIGALITAVHRTIQSRALLKSLASESRYQSEAAGDESGALRTPKACALRLQAIAFSYAGQSSRQIDDLTTTIKPGERVTVAHPDAGILERLDE